MRINDILNMSLKEFNKLTEKELTKIINYMNKVANDRIRRLLKNNLLNTPAGKKVKNIFGIDDKKKNIKMKEVSFTNPKGSTLNEKRNLFIRAKEFLQSKTSTVTGSQQWKKEQKKNLQNFIGGGVDDSFLEDNNKINKFFEIVAKMQELHPSTPAEVKYKLNAAIAEQVENGKDTDDIINSLNEEYEEITSGYESEFIKDNSDPFYSV